MVERTPLFSLELGVDDEGCQMLTVVGELDLTVSDAFAAMGRAAVGSPAAPCVTVDLGRVTFIDSIGLNVLVRIRNAAVRAGKPFRLRSVPAATQKLLVLAGLEFMLAPASPA